MASTSRAIGYQGGPKSRPSVPRYDGAEYGYGEADGAENESMLHWTVGLVLWRLRSCCLSGTVE
jgi:hypothetical protein